MGDDVSLGPCCQCEGSKDVRTIIMLDGLLAPISGRGHGCLQCGLPPNGAIFVLCDACCDMYETEWFTPKFACCGYPGTDGRIPYQELKSGNTDHDMSKHPGEG
jgi:hypothetical protein